MSVWDDNFFIISFLKPFNNIIRQKLKARKKLMIFRTFFMSVYLVLHTSVISNPLKFIANDFTHLINFNFCAQFTQAIFVVLVPQYIHFLL